MPLRHNWAWAGSIEPYSHSCKGPDKLPLHIHNCCLGHSRGSKSQPRSGSLIYGELPQCPGLDSQWQHEVAFTFLRPYPAHRRPTGLSWPWGDWSLGVPPGVAPQVVEVGPPEENSLSGHYSPSHSDWSPQMGLKECHISPHSLCLSQGLRKFTPVGSLGDPSLMYSNLQQVKRQIGDTNSTFESG